MQPFFVSPSFYLSLSFSLSLSPYLTNSLPPILSHTQNSLSLSQRHTHTHIHVHVLSHSPIHTHTHVHTLSLFLHTYIHTHTLHTLTHTHSLSLHTYTHSLSHSHTHTHTQEIPLHTMSNSTDDTTQLLLSVCSQNVENCRWEREIEIKCYNTTIHISTCLHSDPVRSPLRSEAMCKRHLRTPPTHTDSSPHC